MSTSQDFEMWSGETKKILIKVVGQDGAPVDLTGGSAEWILQKSQGNTTLVRKELGSGITIESPVNGEVLVILSPKDTEGLSGYYAHEARITTSSGDVSTVLVGRVIINNSGFN